ncbi:MAG: redoxin domain-containing protein [Nitrospirae bacterium]|nr:redoxin domain-containing protein [Nitrospirota bacterium]MCL5236822.1 redoxin domain-containing protein [Nitrospirota bacterium]
MRGFTGKEKVAVIQLMLILIGVTVVFFTCTATAQALLQVGTQAPEFSLKDIEGKEASLSQYSKSRGVALLFWSTWSANSPKALKKFEAFYRKYKDRGIQVIAINADNQALSNEDVEKLKKLVKDLDLTFPILLDRGLKTFHEYSTIALPSTVIISEGKIAYELAGLPLVGTEDMFDFLLVMAGEPPRKKFEPKYRPRHDAIADAGLARGFVKKKKYEMAYPLFLKAIEKDPQFTLPYIELAKLYETEGRNAEAEGILKKALSTGPENVVAASELGYLLAKTGRLQEATEILGKAAKVNSYTPAHYYLAYALGMGGRLKESLSAFEQALSLNPFEPTTYMLRAEVYEKHKMMKESASDYRKALELILKIKG